MLARFIEGIPKGELHIHIEGALEPELMSELAYTLGDLIARTEENKLR